jgi:hypothetical protein
MKKEFNQESNQNSNEYSTLNEWFFNLDLDTKIDLYDSWRDWEEEERLYAEYRDSVDRFAEEFDELFNRNESNTPDVEEN